MVDKTLGEWSYTSLWEEAARKPKHYEWWEGVDDDPPEEYVLDPDNLTSAVKDIYYRGSKRWTRERNDQMWVPVGEVQPEEPLW